MAINQAEIRERLQRTPTEKLREEMSVSLGLTVEHLTRSALILEELESRGETVEGVSPSLLGLLRRIAAGEVLAEAVVRFAATPRTMDRVLSLPPEKQAEILADKEKQREVLRPQKAADRGMAERRIAATNPIYAAKEASPRDLADMIVEMILAHPRPDAVWDAVRGDIRLVSPKPKRAS